MVASWRAKKMGKEKTTNVFQLLVAVTGFCVINDSVELDLRHEITETIMKTT